MGLHIVHCFCLCTLLINKKIDAITICSSRIDCYCKLYRQPENKKKMYKYWLSVMYTKVISKANFY